MGINYYRAKLMLEAEMKGASFARTLTLGHQKNNMLSSEMKKLSKKFKKNNSTAISSHRYRTYADDFFYDFLGVEKLDIIDFSDYEGAEIIHDLNKPINENMHEKYDAIIDGGSLEHIFNFPMAISNCMNMLKPGGSMFIFSMTNNHCGHGFYQFSPELFFRIFEEKNGFTIKKVILSEHRYPGAELSNKSQCYEIMDPKNYGKRLNIVNSKPLGILVYAKKNITKNIFENFPLQSDYIKSWSSEKNKNIQNYTDSKSKILALKLINLLPLTLRRWLFGEIQLYNSRLSYSKKYLKKWD